MAERFIAIAGNIGVGKTSLVKFLSQQYGVQPVYEPFENNPYLDDYYQDMKAWGFHSQVWFLAHKFRLHSEFRAREGTLIQDRTIYEDAEIFATYLYRSRRMSRRDYETYQELYQAMRATLQPPDLMIYLRCSVKAIRTRIRQRGRASEQNIPVTYLRSLNGLYESWMEGWDACPKMIWDTEKADYLEDWVHRSELQRAVEAVL